MPGPRPKLVRLIPLSNAEKTTARELARSGGSPWRQTDQKATTDTSVRVVCPTCSASFIATPGTGRTAAENLARHTEDHHADHPRPRTRRLTVRQ